MRLALLLLAACPEPSIPASDYCERAVEAFCPYYLRCGRMAVDDEAGCREAFLEACNARYEPHYAALEAEGLVWLSREGLRSCAAHLEEVACDDQIFDLDGGCAGVWIGQAPAGAPCGLGIESFVCDAESTCVLGLDLCGTCEPAAPVGAACVEETRCRPPGSCQGGTCVAGALPGDPCGDELPCVPGAWCEEGTCRSYAIVGPGEACDAYHRCPYKSECAGGVCVETALLGEACGGGVGCASGSCEGGACVPLLSDGAPCERPDQCVSGTCDGTCGALPGVCFE